MSETVSQSLLSVGIRVTIELGLDLGLELGHCYVWWLGLGLGSRLVRRY